MTHDEQTCDQRIAELQSALGEIRARNLRVTLEKRWETSLARRSLVALITYVFASAVFIAIGSTQPLRDALIPVTGYLVSTLSIPWVRERWISKRQA